MEESGDITVTVKTLDSQSRSYTVRGEVYMPNINTSPIQMILNHHSCGDGADPHER